MENKLDKDYVDYLYAENLRRRYCVRDSSFNYSQKELELAASCMGVRQKDVFIDSKGNIALKPLEIKK